MERIIYLAGGCFWGVQKFFDQFDGVLETEVGYANGRTERPAYEELKETGHAETVRIVYDDEVLQLEDLLDDYFMIIDPLSVNKQGPDVGTQYRTGIYYTDASQLPAILTKTGAVAQKLGRPLAVEIGPIENYYTAEEYHQKYLDRIPWGYCHISRNMFLLQEMRRRNAASEAERLKKAAESGHFGE
ncbi:MAG: peptide-methionine (S)-S-oxide reductase MsrA [Mogibacterium sp.]|nr:peptide-methionine (S)-S-oxide reductase MsrA [Mogibacterium sp.]